MSKPKLYEPRHLDVPDNPPPREKPQTHVVLLLVGLVLITTAAMATVLVLTAAPTTAEWCDPMTVCGYR